MATSSGEAVVGIIANPAAGKDIRRLVAQGRVVSNQEKANTVKRVLAGLDAVGVGATLLMPDLSGIAHSAIRGWRGAMRCEMLDYAPTGWQIDSTRCAEMMRAAGAGCIVTIGGDGTNRVVAKGAGDVPLAAVSTGTNNVFPKLIEGTLAGLAAGTVATDPALSAEVCQRACRLDIFADGELRDIALVDAAVSRQSMVGSRAIWDAGNLAQAWLTTSTASAIGISSIGSRLKEVGMFESKGLQIDFARPDAKDALAQEGAATTVVSAPIAPGMIADVAVARWSEMRDGDNVEIDAPGCTIALDGEREIELLRGMEASISLNAAGPLVVDFDAALRHAARSMSGSP